MRLVILDRDGVINEDSPDYIKSVHEWNPLPGSLDAIARLNQAGFHVVVATNQSAVGRGLISIETLTQIHEHMHRQVAAHGGAIEAVFFCPCKPDDQCDCRKPNPGMLLKIIKRTRSRLEDTTCIGDSLRDLQAAQNAGVAAMLVRTGNGTQTETELGNDADVPVFDTLTDAAAALISAAQAS